MAFPGIATDENNTANSHMRHVLLKEAIWRYAIDLISELGTAEAARRLQCSEVQVRHIRNGIRELGPDGISALSGRTASDITAQLRVRAAIQEDQKSDGYLKPPALMTNLNPVRKGRGLAASRRKKQDDDPVENLTVGEMRRRSITAVSAGKRAPAATAEGRIAKQRGQEIRSEKDRGTKF